MSAGRTSNGASPRDSVAAANNETYSNYLHYTRAERNHNSSDPSRTASDASSDPRASYREASREPLAKGIANASPEPESSMEKLSKASSEGPGGPEMCLEEQCVEITRLRNWRNLLITVLVALALALVGTLAGLIFLAATRNIPGSNVDDDLLPSSGSLSSTLADVTSKRTSFEDVSNSDLAIANIFADHSLYQSFYGVNYNGLDTQNCSASGFQRSVAIDVALISRITERVRITSEECNLVEGVLKAISDIKVKLAVTLNVKASEWSDKNSELRRILASYPSFLFDSVLIEQDDTPANSYRAYSELQAFLKGKDIDDVPVRLVDPTSEQPNPLNLVNDANITRSWILSDKARRVYTNLESPAETSEKARAMTSWVCGVSGHLPADIAWFWSTAFDSSSVDNGIFFSDRKSKPAGLPRCAGYS